MDKVVDSSLPEPTKVEEDDDTFEEDAFEEVTTTGENGVVSKKVKRLES